MFDYQLPALALAIAIVDNNKGSKVLDISREAGLQGGTVFFGRGTANRNLFDYLGLNDKVKELVLMIGDEEVAKKALDLVSQRLDFHKPNHGIAYIEPVVNVIGTSSCESGNRIEKEGEEYMYNAIYTIVEKGLSDEVIDAAQEAGSRGGTVINARGSGIHERQKVFSLTIEPEKEIVLILSKVEQTQGIVDSIKNKLHIDEPGRGIIYVTKVKDTYGIR